MRRMATRLIRQIIGQFLSGLWATKMPQPQAQLARVKVTAPDRKPPFALRGGGLRK